MVPYYISRSIHTNFITARIRFNARSKAVVRNRKKNKDIEKEQACRIQLEHSSEGQLLEGPKASPLHFYLLFVANSVQLGERPFCFPFTVLSTWQFLCWIYSMPRYHFTIIFLLRAAVHMPYKTINKRHPAKHEMKETPPQKIVKLRINYLKPCEESRIIFLRRDILSTPN